MGFALMSALFFVMAHTFQKGDPMTAKIAILVFTGFGVFTMSLMSSAIYTEWNNTATYNSSMGVPNTLMNISFWSIWIWVLLSVLGVIFWLMEWYANYKGVKMK